MHRVELSTQQIEQPVNKGTYGVQITNHIACRRFSIIRHEDRKPELSFPITPFAQPPGLLKLLSTRWSTRHLRPLSHTTY
jgi:hypothetical protein